MRSLVLVPVLASSIALFSGCAAGEDSDLGGGEEALTANACENASSPELGAKKSWNHQVEAWAITKLGWPNHRGRDQIFAEGAPQWIIGKIAYGITDKDLKGEDVDVFVERGCGGSWEKLATVRTTEEDAHPEVEGVSDSGGRVYFEIPAAKRLPAGRHRVRLVVGGDHSSTDLIVDVLSTDVPLVVSDIDGTLTSSENAEWGAILQGKQPSAHADSANVMKELARRGHHIVYVTARPEFLTGRSREFLKQYGFPPGILHTTTGLTGALGGAAVDYKTRELSLFQNKGFKITWVFGNKSSDGDAYQNANIQPLEHRIFFKHDDTHGGRRIESYTDLLPELRQ